MDHGSVGTASGDAFDHSVLGIDQNNEDHFTGLEVEIPESFTCRELWNCLESTLTPCRRRTLLHDYLTSKRTIA